MGQVRNEISRYINQVVTGWRQSQTKYIKDMTYQLTKSLKEEIKHSIQVIEDDIKSLNAILAQNEAQRIVSRKRLEGLKSEHYRLLQRLQAIRNIKVDTFTETPSNAPTEQPVSSSAKRGYYSNLEE
jgi:DNA gyrase/topoisomerase IV subunit A